MNSGSGGELTARGKDALGTIYGFVEYLVTTDAILEEAEVLAEGIRDYFVKDRREFTRNAVDYVNSTAASEYVPDLAVTVVATASYLIGRPVHDTGTAIGVGLARTIFETGTDRLEGIGIFAGGVGGAAMIGVAGLAPKPKIQIPSLGIRPTLSGAGAYAITSSAVAVPAAEGALVLSGPLLFAAKHPEKRKPVMTPAKSKRKAPRKPMKKKGKTAKSPTESKSKAVKKTARKKVKKRKKLSRKEFEEARMLMWEAEEQAGYIWERIQNYTSGSGDLSPTTIHNLKWFASECKRELKIKKVKGAARKFERYGLDEFARRTRAALDMIEDPAGNIPNGAVSRFIHD